MIRISMATADDLDALVELTDELDCFYDMPNPDSLDVRRRQIHEALFEDPPLSHALLARDDRYRPIGFATYTFLWPAAGLSRSLYLKEVFVTESRKRRGVGRRLMAVLVDIAREKECSRVEWTTDRDNPDAQAFYRSLGFEPNPSKLFYRHDALMIGASADDPPGEAG